MNNRVLIAEDHPAVRMAVKVLMASEGFDVVAETDNGVDALELVEGLCPSTLILDIGIPVMDGLVVIDKIVEKQLPVKIVVLTGLSHNHLASRCRQMGAHGFVGKQSELSELVYAVRAVQSDKDYFPCLSPVQHRSIRAPSESELLRCLSSREFQVMQHLAQGFSNKEIAHSLLLNKKTVSTYKTRLLLKLNVSSLIELYDLAKRNGVA